MGDVARLVRAPQLLVAALGVLAGCWIALGGLATPPLAWWAALAAIGLGAAGSALGRRRDVTASSGAADFVVFAGVMLVGGAAVAVGLAGCAAIALLPALERRQPFQRIALAVVSGLPLLYGAIAVARPAQGLVPWTLASWLEIGRGLAADAERQPGRPWLTIVLAI